MKYREWQHESILLIPKSSDKRFENIVLQDNELEELKIIGVIECYWMINN